MSLILLMLYFPFVIMFVLSWQGPRGGHTLPLRGLSTIWWFKLFHPGAVAKYSDVGEFLGNYLGAFERTVVLAFITMIISTTFALLAAMAFRKRFRGSGLVFYLWLLGIIIPGISVSLGLSLFFKQTDIQQNWWTTGLAVHVMWTLPFCLVIFLIAFNRFDPALEDAAMACGANKLRTFWHVTLPNLSFGILSSLLFAFTLSLDEFQRSLLVEGVSQTLPLMVIASVTTRITPTLYALGSFTTLISLAVIAAYLILVARRARKRARPFAVEEEYAGTREELAAVP
jgi:putative spermidine/putrescine transport system permease protein